MAKSIIFCTTETSGTGSLWRILSSIVKGNLKPVAVTSSDGHPPTLEGLNPSDHLYLVRGTGEFSGKIYSPNFRYIVNVRDPRDMLCNQYYWLTQHPVKSRSEILSEDIIKNNAITFEEGIDKYVLLSNKEGSFRLVKEITAEERPDILCLSYNQLCCGFDSMIGRIVDFIGCELSKHAERVIDKERPENLVSNERWIGQKWFGTDILPGRYKKELKNETISQLNLRYSALLHKLAELEQEEFKHSYSIDSE